MRDEVVAVELDPDDRQLRPAVRVDRHHVGKRRGRQEFLGWLG
jgi:hypothetical protein